MYQVAQALGAIGGRKVIPTLKKILHTPTKGSTWENSRLAGAAMALAILKDRSVIAYTKKAFENADWQTRKMAAAIAGRLRDVQFVKPLIRRLAVEKNARVIKNVYWALFYISKKKGLSAAHRKLINRVFTLYREGKRNSSKQAANKAKLLQLAK